MYSCRIRTAFIKFARDNFHENECFVTCLTPSVKLEELNTLQNTSLSENYHAQTLMNKGIIRIILYHTFLVLRHCLSSDTDRSMSSDIDQVMLS